MIMLICATNDTKKPCSFKENLTLTTHGSGVLKLCTQSILKEICHRQGTKARIGTCTC